MGSGVSIIKFAILRPLHVINKLKFSYVILKEINIKIWKCWLTKVSHVKRIFIFQVWFEYIYSYIWLLAILNKLMCLYYATLYLITRCCIYIRRLERWRQVLMSLKPQMSTPIKHKNLLWSNMRSCKGCNYRYAFQ